MTTWNQHQYEKQKAEVQTFAILSNPRPGERGQPWPVAEATGRTADEALNHHARRLGFASADDARTRQHPGTGFHLLTAEPREPAPALEQEPAAVLSEPAPRPSAADLRGWVAESGTDAQLTAFDALTTSDPAADWKAEADRLRHALAVEKAEHASTRAQRDAARALLVQAQPLIQAAGARLGIPEPGQTTAQRAKVAL